MIRNIEVPAKPEDENGRRGQTGPKVPAVQRAVRVLHALRGGGRRLSDLSQELGLSMSTLSDLLATLEETAMVERDPVSRTFRLGPAVVELGLAARRELGLTRAARPELDWLRDTTGETAILHVPSGDAAVIVDATESLHQLKVVAPVGHRLPAFAGSVAKVLLAGSADERVRSALGPGPLPAFTARCVTDPDVYRAELRRVRERGYATDDEEYIAGVRAVSAPVTGEGGDTVAVITVIGASSRVSRSRLGPLADEVMTAAARVSGRLGAGVTAGPAATPAGSIR